MKKKSALIILFFSSMSYLISSSGWVMREIVPYRDKLNSPLGSDIIRYGDLYGFCYLKDFKIPFCSDPVYIQLDKFSGPKNIDLYIVHDSYLKEPFITSDSVFCGVNKYYSLHDERNNISLDASRTNVLVIEIVERDFREYSKKRFYLINNSGISNIQQNLHSTLQQTYRTVFNPLIDQNLEYNIFDYDFFIPIKEFKAWLNYKLFNRINSMVAISSDKKYLYLSSTIDTSTSSSSFSQIDSIEIGEIVNELNYKYNYYKSIGFREVYFSIIPNPVTILNTENYRYNELIPKIQNNKNLKMPMIDIYSVFRRQNIQLYNKSDSHWTINGSRLWLNELNKKLAGLTGAEPVAQGIQKR